MDLEQILIKQLKSNDNRYGYNITDGGESCTGYHHTEETKDIIAEKVSYKIKQYDLNGNFIKSWRSAQVAARELNIDGSGILKCCKGIYHSSQGFIWRYENDSYDKYIRKKYQQPTLRKRVKQYDMKGNYIKTWKSISEAAVALHLSSNSSICSCCKMKRKSAYGYIWRYE